MSTQSLPAASLRTGHRLPAGRVLLWVSKHLILRALSSICWSICGAASIFLPALREAVNFASTYLLSVVLTTATGGLPIPALGNVGTKRTICPYSQGEVRSSGQLKKRAGRKSASSALCRPRAISSATAAPRNGDIVTPLWVTAI